jgi:hypothetical protein
VETKGILPLLLAAGIVIVVVVLIQKRQALAAANSVQASGYTAIANTVNGKVDGILGNIPGGSYVGDAVTQPVKNVTTGNYSAVLGSAATGGLSDFSSALNPFGW